MTPERTHPIQCSARVLGLLSVAFLITGCAGTRKELGTWEGPTAPASVVVEASKVPPLKVVRTPHYRIYSTVTDDETVQKIAQTLEGGLTQYRRIVPNIVEREPGRPMDAYVFATRAEWAQFTRERTGVDAQTYLQINRGGYTIRDWFAGFWIGDGTYPMVAHEGWHQFVGRNFVARLPPFMDEGFACTFENLRWQQVRSGEVPQFNLSRNRGRALALRNAIDDRKTFPLPELVSMHAGDVISMPPDRVDAFYAQNWAFARFLWEGNGAKYRPALQRLLTDLSTGNGPDGKPRPGVSALGWQPKAVRPMLEEYLGVDLVTLDKEYQTYVRDVAYDELNAQWDL